LLHCCHLFRSSFEDGYFCHKNYELTAYPQFELAFLLYEEILKNLIKFIGIAAAIKLRIVRGGKYLTPLKRRKS